MKSLPLFLLATTFASAQDGGVIKVNVNLVNVLCTVHNKAGGLVGNLEKTDFTLFEDGKQQEIKYFTRESDLPLTIGLLVDVSASQERLIETERNAAHQFFTRVLRPKDEAFLISFGAEAELLQDYTSSPKLLLDGLNQLHLSVPVGGLHPGPVPTMQNRAGTILYDAVFLASDEKLKKEVGRKAIVVITDGVDTGSKITRDKSIEAALKADSIIYSIFYQDVAAYGRLAEEEAAGASCSECPRIRAARSSTSIGVIRSTRPSARFRTTCGASTPSDTRPPTPAKTGPSAKSTCACRTRTTRCRRGRAITQSRARSESGPRPQRGPRSVSLCPSGSVKVAAQRPGLTSCGPAIKLHPRSVRFSCKAATLSAGNMISTAPTTASPAALPRGSFRAMERSPALMSVTTPGLPTRGRPSVSL